MTDREVLGAGIERTGFGELVALRPPRTRFASNTVTQARRASNSRAQAKPAMPAPTTATRGLAGARVTR